MKTTQLDIAIVDDDLLFLEAMESLISSNENFNVLFTSSIGAEIEELITSKGKPHILVLDLKLRDQESGLVIGERIKKTYPDLSIIALSSFYKPAYIATTIKLGFSCFLPKHVSTETLFDAFKRVYEDGVYVRSEDFSHLQKFLQDPSTESKHLNFKNSMDLSEREIEVLREICKQNSNQEIADKLFISVRTVEGHRNRILEKTGVKNTVGLAYYAVVNNLIDLTEIDLRHQLE